MGVGATPFALNDVPSFLSCVCPFGHLSPVPYTSDILANRGLGLCFFCFPSCTEAGIMPGVCVVLLGTAVPGTEGATGQNPEARGVRREQLEGH